MTNQDKILSQIKPCDTGRPYIFISYSSSNSETVWADVLRFQQDGYNIWLDEKNLDKRKESWKDDALRAISSRRCRLLLFYVSATSLCSEACLRELQETLSERTITNHLTPVPFVAIDVEEIGNIIDFCNQVHRQLDEQIADDDKFEQKAQVLNDFRNHFFNGNNDRVRVHPRIEPNRKGDYYADIQNSFPDQTRLYIPTAKPAPTPEPAPVPEPTPVPAGGDLHVSKTLSVTDIKYNICTFGSAMHIGLGAPVTLEMGGKRYEKKMHNVTKGRVDGLKQFYTDQGLVLGDVLDARYSAAENTIHLTKVSG